MLLVALVVRALIPAGFMPATDRPLSFQICPDGFPAALLPDAAPLADGPAGHHHHDNGDPLAHAGHHHDSGGLLAVAHHHDGPSHNHSSASAEHCVFAAAAGAFALAFAATLAEPVANISAPDVAYVSPAFESNRFRLPQPRGPPALS